MSNQFAQTLFKMSRRAVLRATGAGATVILTGGVAELLTGCSTLQQITEQAIPSANATARTPAKFAPDVEIALTATKGAAQIVPGELTQVLTYQGKLLKGGADVLQSMAGAYLGPIIRVHRGQKVRIHFKNALPEESNIHWHGLLVPPEMDGHPKDVVGPGETYIYEFELRNRAGTYWYHPHPHQRTAPQVYAGLAGLLLVADAEETALGLPTAYQDIPLIIQDRTLDTNNQLVYSDDNMMGMMNRMMGFLGEIIVVNGQADFTLPVATRVYRLRLLNGSNARIFKLAWSNRMPMTVLATDGGLLEKPVQHKYVMLAPAERVELWVDFSGHDVGAAIKLQSLAYTGVEAGMMNRAALPNGAPFDILTVRVEKSEAEARTLPAKLSSLEPYRLKDAANHNNPRQIALVMKGMNWTLSGKTFEMDAVDQDETVAFNRMEVWEFANEMNAASMMGGGMMGGDNKSGQGMMSLAHPIHIHGVQFRVVGRQVTLAGMVGWQTVKDGLIEEGWKDTVLVMPGEQVKLLMRFADYSGLYLYHCHNLEHEDMGMMRNYLIQA